MDRSKIKVRTRGNRIWVEMPDRYFDIFFRAGLQKFADKQVGKGKVVVLPEGMKPTKKAKKVTFTKEEYDSFVRDAILDSIVALLDRLSGKPKGGKV